MKKVITYGTFDLLHRGHIRLLERAKALGDYLVVGVTSDDFDRRRGKINVQQSLMERIQNVKKTGLADEIIVEEYEGQKIDNIVNYGIDVFTVGSDWKGKFDYLKDYCEVVYLPRTTGISSSDIRTEDRKLKLGIVGAPFYINKWATEANYVNGIDIAAICTNNPKDIYFKVDKNVYITNNYSELLKKVDAVYLISHPSEHYKQIKDALNNNVNVLCETPICLSTKETSELFKLADKNKCILMESIKTAYSIAYDRLLLLLKGGIIGDVISVDSTCTSLRNFDIKNKKKYVRTWNSITSWGCTALLPIFQILGTNYNSKQINSMFIDKEKKIDMFTKIDFVYNNAVASIKVGKGVKSEGELIISGTKGYVYVPAPWWKTDYFEVRYENTTDNKRYFYQLEGEGIRNELVAFATSIKEKRHTGYISRNITYAICEIMEDFEKKKNINEINN